MESLKMRGNFEGQRKGMIKVMRDIDTWVYTGMFSSRTSAVYVSSDRF